MITDKNGNVIETSKELVITEEQSTLLSVNNPADIMKFAGTLKKFIADNKLSCIIQGKNYVYVDGWKFAGLNFGIIPMAEDPKCLPGNDGEYKYSCSCKLIRVIDDKIVGAGFAICTNKESKKKSFDEYAIASMAQTRAIAKAFRNLFGFIMSAAGFEGTPAEEMEAMKTGGHSETEYGKLKDQCDLLNTNKELEDYYNSMPEYHKDQKVIQIFKKRRTEINKPK